MIKAQRPITLINTCGAIYSESELAKAMIWYSSGPLQRIKKVSLHGEYPSVSIGNKKIHIHRLIAMYCAGNILPSDIFVHHLDGNKLNAEKSNLQLIAMGQHQSNHNAGKILSDKHKAKIAVANSRRKGTTHKPSRPDVTSKDVYCLRKQGMSFNQISKRLKLDWCCVKRRYEDFIHENPELLEVPDES